MFGSNTVTSSYWDTQTSGQITSAAGIGLTTAQLKSGLPTGFDPAVWGINASINNGYPYLLWQNAFQPPFMAFPLECGVPKCKFKKYTQGAYTPGVINSVLDHSLQKYPSPSTIWQYGTLNDGGGDGIIVAFNGDCAAHMDSPLCKRTGPPQNNTKDGVTCIYIKGGISTSGADQYAWVRRP